MIFLEKKQMVMLCTLFAITENLQASTATTTPAPTTVHTKPSMTSIKNNGSGKKPAGIVKKSKKGTAQYSTNKLTSNEKQMIEDFIKTAHEIPNNKSEKTDHKKFRAAVDKAFKAYEKLYHYENFISDHGMDVPDITNGQIKEAAKILFNKKHIEHMVWQLKTDRTKKIAVVQNKILDKA